MRLDLNKLDHLIAVAEEGSLTRAAARLHLSQQALSTSIRVLEREVGVPLLERGSAGVTVLPAGAALIEDARVLNGVARAALRRARHIGRGETQALRIGYTPAVTGDELVTLLAPVTEAHPDITPEIHQRYPSELSAALLAGDLDIGLCRAITPAHGLTRTTLGQHRLHIAVARDHPLAARTSVTLPELAHETFLVWGTPAAPATPTSSSTTAATPVSNQTPNAPPSKARPLSQQSSAPATSPSSPHHRVPRRAAKRTSSPSNPHPRATPRALPPHATCPSRTTFLSHVRL